MSSINKFISQLNDGVAQNNLFRCTFVGVPGIKSDDPVLEKMQFFCKSVTIPADTLTTIEQYRNNKNYQVINGRDFDSISTIFLINNGQEITGFMNNWFDLAVGPANDFVVNYKDNYKCNYLIVEQLNRELVPTVTYKFHDLYPVNKQISGFSYDSDNQPTELTVNFNFEWYEIEINNPTPSAFSPIANFARSSIPSIGQINTLRKIF